MSVPAEVPSTAAAMDRVSLSDPEAVVAALPHLVGFPPRESLVMVGVQPDGSGRARQIGLVMRADLPGTDADFGTITAYTAQVAAPMARSGAATVVAVVHSDQPLDADGPLPYAQLADQLALELSEHDLAARDLLFTDGSSYWSYGCDDPGCCPPAGRTISEQTRTWVAAQFAGAGYAMADSRDAVVNELTPDRDRAAEVADRLDDAATPTDVEAWRDQAIAAVTSLSTPHAPAMPDIDTCALVLSGLADIRVRDTALWDLAQRGVDRHAAITGLRDVLRSAPPEHIPPVATVLAVQHWQTGDGLRANACLDHALAHDRDYALANLTANAIRTGMPPSTWTDMMATLGRDICRRLDPPPSATPVTTAVTHVAAHTPDPSIPDQPAPAQAHSPAPAAPAPATADLATGMSL